MSQQPGFSQPDPAPVPGQDDAEELGVEFIPEGGSILDVIDDRVSCENCKHYRVCALIAGFRGMTEQWGAGGEDDDAPIDATDFAVICEEFSPVDELR